MKKKLSCHCFAALILTLACTFPANAQIWFMGNPLLGKPAPEFTLETLKSKKESLSSYRDGNAAIVFFWATWCPHCREQLAHLEVNKDSIEKKGIKILLVDLGESKQKVKAFVDSKKINFDVFLDKESSVADDYAIIGVPTFFFIDKNGIVLSVEHFMPENLDEIFEESAQAHLQE